MVLIQAWVDGRAFGKRGAGIGVKLSCGQHSWVRTFNCGKITTNQAEMKGVEYILKSIRSEFEENEIVIRTTNKYAQMMLERSEDKWVKVVSSNIPLVKKVREEFLRFPRISIFSDPEDEDIVLLKQINEAALRKKTTVFDK